MEVTSVSSSATSPTEGDNLCEIDGSTVAIHSVTLLISLCGLVGNGAVLWLIGLKSDICNIFDLAFADFLFLLFTVPSTLVFLVEDMSCSPILSLLYLSFLFQLSLVSYYWALFWPYRESIMDYVEMLCKLCCRWRPPDRLLWLVYSVQYWAFFALFAVIPAVTLQCPSHHQEHCRAALISTYTVFLLLFVVPIVIFRTINFCKAKRGSKEQQRKIHDIVISLVMLLVFLLSLSNFLQQLGYILVSSQVVFLLSCIQGSIKPFIYFLAGRCWRPCSVRSLRLSLKRVFDEPEENTAHSSDASEDEGV